MKSILLIFVAFLTGCYGSPAVVGINAWETAPLDYICTAVEMVRVEREAKWCKENTGYLGTYCYGSAMMRSCAMKRGEPKP